MRLGSSGREGAHHEIELQGSRTNPLEAWEDPTELPFVEVWSVSKSKLPCESRDERAVREVEEAAAAAVAEVAAAAEAAAAVAAAVEVAQAAAEEETLKQSEADTVLRAEAAEAACAGGNNLQAPPCTLWSRQGVGLGVGLGGSSPLAKGFPSPPPPFVFPPLLPPPLHPAVLLPL